MYEKLYSRSVQTHFLECIKYLLNIYVDECEEVRNIRADAYYLFIYLHILGKHMVQYNIDRLLTVELNILLLPL